MKRCLLEVGLEEDCVDLEVDDIANGHLLPFSVHSCSINVVTSTVHACMQGEEAFDNPKIGEKAHLMS